MSDEKPTKGQLIDRFKGEVDSISWGYLQPHYDRDGVILVDNSLDLIEVACAVSLDNQAEIEKHIGSGKLAKPNPAQVERWQESYTVFTCLIVQPFVLAQEKGDGSQ